MKGIKMIRKKPSALTGTIRKMGIIQRLKPLTPAQKRKWLKQSLKNLCDSNKINPNQPLEKIREEINKINDEKRRKTILMNFEIILAGIKKEKQ